MNLAARYFCPSSRWNPLDSSDFPDLSSYLSSRLNSMSLNESIVEDAALEWFLLRQGSGGQVGALGTAVGHLPALRSSTRQAGGPQLAPGEHAGGTLIPASPTGRGEEASACALCTDRRAILANSATVQTRRRVNP